MNEERFNRIIRDMTIHHPQVVSLSNDLFSIHFAITYEYLVFGHDYQKSDCGYIMRCKKIGDFYTLYLERDNGSCVFHHRGGCTYSHCGLSENHKNILFQTLIHHPKLRLRWLMLSK